MTNVSFSTPLVASEQPVRSATIYDLPPEVFGRILYMGTDRTTATVVFQKTFEKEGCNWKDHGDWSAFYTLRALNITRNSKESPSAQVREVLKTKFQELKAAYPLLATSIAKQIKDQHYSEQDAFNAMQEPNIIKHLKPIYKKYKTVDLCVNNFYTSLFFIMPLLLATSLTGLIVGLATANPIGFLVATAALITYILFCSTSSLTLFALYKLFLDKDAAWAGEFFRLERRAGLRENQL